MDFNAGQLGVLENVASGEPLARILASIVQLIEGQADGMLCSMVLSTQRASASGTGPPRACRRTM